MFIKNLKHSPKIIKFNKCFYCLLLINIFIYIKVNALSKVETIKIENIKQEEREKNLTQQYILNTNEYTKWVQMADPI